MTTRYAALITLLIIVSAPVWGAGQTTFGNYAEAREAFWGKLYDAPHQDATSVYCEVPLAERNRLNVEHAYPQEWLADAFNCGDKDDCEVEGFHYAAADLHNLWPALTRINSSRQNLPYAELSGERLRAMTDICDNYERSYTRHPQSPAVEPRDGAKGDLARSILYMSMTYDLPLRGMGPMLLRWHFDDPPDSYERWRNRMIDDLQGTENPLISRTKCPPGECIRLQHEDVGESMPYRPPVTNPEEVTLESSVIDLRASRAFYGPHRYPPVDAAAYGIVAFPQKATSSTRERHLAICEAYLAGLPASESLEIEIEDQMVTVWPIGDEGIAHELKAKNTDGPACSTAVKHYHLPTSLQALKDAVKAGADIPAAARGPFMIAWAPATTKGESGVPVLIADLSQYDNSNKIAEVFRKWRRDIEKNPDVWRGGWSLEAVRVALRDWADKYGKAVLIFWQSVSG